MAHADNSVEATRHPQSSPAAENALRVGERVEPARRKTNTAQRAAAGSFDKSAESHERIAEAYDTLTEQGDGGAAEHGARHREFAQEDREIADRLREMADYRLEGEPTSAAGVPRTRCAALKRRTALRRNGTRSWRGYTSGWRTAISAPPCAGTTTHPIGCRTRPTVTGRPRTIITCDRSRTRRRPGKLRAKDDSVTDAKPHSFLRDVKIPSAPSLRATNSLRDYLVDSAAKDHSSLSPGDIEEHNKRVLDGLLTSHFEVVDYLGRLEETLQQGDRPRGLL